MYEVQNMMWEKLHQISGVAGRDKNDDFRDLFQQLIKAIDIKMFLEVGAHEAAFSKALASQMPAARIFAYEANPFVYEKYKLQLSQSIEYINSAVGADSSKKTFYIPRSIPTQSGALNIAQANKISSLHSRSAENVVHDEVTCDCTTIDTIMENNGWLGPSALWIDVEGAVGDVLFGAHRALQRNVAMIFVEVEDKAAWVGQWLASDVMEYLSTKKFVPAVRDCETKWQYNQIYIHENYLNREVLKLIESYMAYLVSKVTTDPHVQM